MEYKYRKVGITIITLSIIPFFWINVLDSDQCFNCLIISIALLIVGYLLILYNNYYVNYKVPSIKKTYMKVDGYIQRVKRTLIDGPCYIVIDYYINDKKYTMKSFKMPFNPTELLKEYMIGVVPVYVSKKNPNNVYFDLDFLTSFIEASCAKVDSFENLNLDYECTPKRLIAIIIVSCLFMISSKLNLNIFLNLGIIAIFAITFYLISKLQDTKIKYDKIVGRIVNYYMDYN